MFYDIYLRKMRKITNDAVKCFFEIRNFHRDNTEVMHVPGRVEMSLFNNLIATYWIKDWIVELQNKWRKTVTTKERLNWILEYMHKWYIFQYKGDWFWIDEKQKTRPFGKGIAFSILSK